MSDSKYVLVDSSAWINYFRYGNTEASEKINTLLDKDRAALCGMVELEILQGMRKKEQIVIQDLFRSLYFIEAIRDDFINAGLMLNNLRTKGITIPSSDCLIAAQCLRKGFSILTLDNDFNHIESLKKW